MCTACPNEHSWPTKLLLREYRTEYLEFYISLIRLFSHQSHQTIVNEICKQNEILHVLDCVMPIQWASPELLFIAICDSCKCLITYITEDLWETKAQLLTV